MFGLGRVARWSARIGAVLIIVCSIALNGALLFSTGLSNLLSGLLDGVGIKTPYSSLQAKNRRLDSRNKAMAKQQIKTRNAVSRHVLRRKSTLAKKAIRKSGAVAAKGAAVAVPLVANGVLLLSAASEAKEVTDLCAEAEELNALMLDIGAEADPEQSSEVCGVYVPTLPDLPDWVPEAPDWMQRAFD